ncbi:MAG: hypothetical protein E7368_03750 [Clostridiales bacterium]|nr:hypothetical protein [Clostridiales bacterium]
MKRKIFLTVATLLATTTLFASCSCDGCAGDTKVSFKPYFMNDVDIHAKDDDVETLKYKVEFNGSGSSANGYTLNYQNGEYTSTLAVNMVENKEVYTLTTHFSIDVSYTYAGVSVVDKDGKPFKDTVDSTITFYSTQEGLQPIKSTKTAVSHSPSQATIQKPEDCYTYYNQTIETIYEGNKGTSTITDHTKSDWKEESTFEIDTKKYSFVDNEQLLFALRCLNPNSAKLSVYSPFVEAVQTIAVDFSTDKDSLSLTLNGEEKKIPFNKVSLGIDAKNAGSKQTVWIAKTVNPNSNTYRNVMLKYETPFPYSLGSLTYTLVSADFIK